MAECNKHGVVEEQIKTLFERLKNTEEKTDKNVNDIQVLKESKAENKILLETIQKEIIDIKEILQKKNERLPTIVGVILGSSVSGVIVWLITSR